MKNNIHTIKNFQVHNYMVCYHATAIQFLVPKKLLIGIVTQVAEFLVRDVV